MDPCVFTVGYDGFGLLCTSSEHQVDKYVPYEDVGELLTNFFCIYPKPPLSQFIEEVQDSHCPPNFDFEKLPLEIKFKVFEHLDELTAETLVRLTGLKIDPKKAALHVYRHAVNHDVFEKMLNAYPYMKKLTVLIKDIPQYRKQEEVIRTREVTGMKFDHLRRWTSLEGEEFFAVTYTVTRH
ncbi:unnamed protein product [Bursaphelenchus xylophilus]|uniref:(pine wood nematode) hypothetical protein n=1 Tax=Bursaphelenchus xylophilus TaxID=6326 RepID=A0A1I7SLD1_BURXY|nr:unnamed protein product [Bursaphelenchus xylophilus]CAG9129501.1 unnamed protein product [Bursaphelenchus xylophilus]